jgi:hypothetical protein
MKASWQRPGRATGSLRCRLRLPAVDEVMDVQRASSLLEVRRFIDKNLSMLSQPAREGAVFTISVEWRAPKHGSRWRPICRWREGDSVSDVFERAAAVLSAISREPRHETAAYRGWVRSRALLGLPKG